MNLEIANMVMNIGEATKGFDWGDFWTALFAAFFGALAAFYLNILAENKNQKEKERSILIQLFYDINLIAKYFYLYSNNVNTLIISTSKGKTPYNTPLCVNAENININDCGFIANYSCKLYETLTHMQLNIVKTIEQGIIYNEAVINKKKDAILQLLAINELFPKVLAQVYTNLYSINALLISKYKNENLIKDNLLNTFAEIQMFISEAKKQYNNILKDDSYIYLVTGKKYTKEQKENILENIDYIDCIMNTWIEDFKLNSKIKKQIEASIQNVIKSNRQEGGDDL